MKLDSMSIKASANKWQAWVTLSLPIVVILTAVLVIASTAQRQSAYNCPAGEHYAINQNDGSTNSDLAQINQSAKSTDIGGCYKNDVTN